MLTKTNGLWFTIAITLGQMFVVPKMTKNAPNQAVGSNLASRRCSPTKIPIAIRAEMLSEIPSLTLIHLTRTSSATPAESELGC